MEAVDGKIVITRKDGSQAVVTYSEAKSPADVSRQQHSRSGSCVPACSECCMRTAMDC